MDISHLPNVEQIRYNGIRIVNGKIPRSVRKELTEGIRMKLIGRLKRDGLKPEIFYHPDQLHTAKDIQNVEAMYKIDCIKKVVC